MKPHLRLVRLESALRPDPDEEQERERAWAVVESSLGLPPGSARSLTRIELLALADHLRETFGGNVVAFTGAPEHGSAATAQRCGCGPCRERREADAELRGLPDGACPVCLLQSPARLDAARPAGRERAVLAVGGAAMASGVTLQAVAPASEPATSRSLALPPPTAVSSWRHKTPESD